MQREIEMSKVNRYLSALYLAICFYCIGVLTMENDVNYSTWHTIGINEFSAYHNTLESLLKYFLFTPLAIAFILNVILSLQNPLKEHRLFLIISAVLLFYIILVSLLIQVPLHNKLDTDFSAYNLDKLIKSHRIFRLPATVGLAIINIIFLNRLIEYRKSGKYLR